MIKLTELIRERDFDDFSNIIIECGLAKRYDNCTNSNIICEASLSRLLSRIEDNDFAIITAFIGDLSKKENIHRNVLLRNKFNEQKMGVYMLVGHWQECLDRDIPYDKCPKDKLIDVVEKSFLVVRPNSLSFDEFIRILIANMKIENISQNAILIGISEQTSIDKHKKKGYYIINNIGQWEYIGDKLSLNKVGQAYSQFVKKMNVPFVFEGLEKPSGNWGRQIFQNYNIKYYDVNIHGK